jgi:maltooligosyltrehalose trehalohydrolase
VKPEKGAKVRRRLPVGAERVTATDAHFRVWAPRANEVELVVEEQGSRTRSVRLEPEPDGYFSTVAEATAGTLYRYRLDRAGMEYPDPVSRFQPAGPHGPSMVVDPDVFAWTDGDWPGVELTGQVLYEMHIGTFTAEGTWAAAARELGALARSGITVVEVMPVADFPGRFGWGYDGVNLFAPTRLYGSPDDFRRFVDAAHAAGMGVILDVVYNHVGPDGNYLDRFSPDYFSKRHQTDWGPAINYDGENSRPVREYVVGNAGYWIAEFHLDGLRLDATQSIHDDSAEHILAAISRGVREAAGSRHTIVVAEDESQNTRLVRPLDAGGYGLDGIWNDDFHHAVTVALTGRREGYYSDYRGSAQELVSSVKYGFLYQGQRYAWQKKSRGTPTFGVRPPAFLLYLENHDQVSNSLWGRRSHAGASPARHRALTAFFLLAPGTPLLFQGQEFGTSSPFLFFTDLNPDLAASIRDGRAEFLAQFAGLSDPEVRSWLADPTDPATFERSKLDLSERERHPEAYALHCDLLALRRSDPVFRAQGGGGIDGAVLGPQRFALRYFGSEGDDRLLLVNLGLDAVLESVSEPLVAPPVGRQWELLWTSEAPRYGGGGTPALSPDKPWRLAGGSAVVLRPSADREHDGD